MSRASGELRGSTRALEAAVAGARRRLVAARAARGAIWAALFGAPAWLALAALMRASWVAPAAALAMAAAGALFARRPTLRWAALRLDAAYGLDWRASTAWDHRASPAPMARLLMEDASARLPKRLSLDKLGARPPLAASLALLLLAGGAPGLRWLTEPHRSPHGTSEGVPAGGAAEAGSPPGPRAAVPGPSAGAVRGPDERTATPGRQDEAPGTSDVAPGEAGPASGESGDRPGAASASAEPPAGGRGETVRRAPEAGAPGGSEGAGPGAGGTARGEAPSASSPGAVSPSPADPRGSREVPLLAAGSPAASGGPEAPQEVPVQALLVAPGQSLLGGPSALPMRYAPVVRRYLEASPVDRR